jgi:hypothetical protein
MPDITSPLSFPPLSIILGTAVQPLLSVRHAQLLKKGLAAFSFCRSVEGSHQGLCQVLSGVEVHHAPCEMRLVKGRYPQSLLLRFELLAVFIKLFHLSMVIVVR